MGPGVEVGPGIAAAIIVCFWGGRLIDFLWPFTKTGWGSDRAWTDVGILLENFGDKQITLSMLNSVREIINIQNILDYAWNNRLQNGLIPWMEGDTKAHLDSQVDFAISFRRYAQLADDPGYLLKSSEIMNNTVREHYSPQGYFTYSGQSEHNVIDPKYNALLLKGMINLVTIDSPLYPTY